MLKSESNNKTIRKKLLLALIPYTKQNALLIFKPNLFFDQLESKTGYSQYNLKRAYERIKKDKIIRDTDHHIEILLKGQQIIQPFIAKKIPNNAILMVIFDIPEENADRRRKFRYLLRQLKFKQVQQSVWSTNMDYRDLLSESIIDLKIESWTQLYESSRIQ
ncbi:MAG: CRISPR-associated endonuclease Cas2 [Candidatus Saccharibacteria bacterium]